MFCLTSSCVLCARCCQHLWVVHFGFPLDYWNMRVNSNCAPETKLPWVRPRFVWGLWCSISFLCSVFVDHCLSFFCWSLYCLPFDLRLLITPLVSLNLFDNTDTKIKITNIAIKNKTPHNEWHSNSQRWSW